MLKRGERLIQGDKYLSGLTLQWLNTNAVGAKTNRADRYIRKIESVPTAPHPLPQGDGPDIAKLVRADVEYMATLGHTVFSTEYIQAITKVFELRQAIWEREGK